ncbi:MAG: PQQ-binding-like beta-propeller repeat protein [Planctomycetota bacterium]
MNNLTYVKSLIVYLALSTTFQVFAHELDDRTQAYWEAARTGDLAAIESAIKDKLDLNSVTEFNCGAIYFAANRNQAKVIRLLAKAGADVNLRDTDYGFTPVQMAAWLGHTDATEALIDSGATKDDVIGSCYAAASNGHAETVKLIVQKMEIPKTQLSTIWKTAHNSGAENVCKVLEELGATPLETDKDGDNDGAVTTPNQSAGNTKFDFESDRPVPINKPKNWLAFRGDGRSGNGDGQYPPAAFDLKAKRNIRWTVPVEGLGLSSPVIWNNRIYITTAVSSSTKQTVDDGGLGWIASVPENIPHEWKVLCFDLETGEKVWERTACKGKPKSARHWKASQANPTCVTDGKNLVACFGSEGLYCYDLDGNEKWSQEIGDLTNGWYIDSTFPWGFASSPIIYKEKVILQCDVYKEPFIAAYNIEDGQQVWKTKRENELSSWGTPLVVAAEGRGELITNASKSVRSYNPDNGELLWQIDGNSTITVSSPIAADGVMVATGGYKTPKPIYVVRTGVGNGNITPETDQSSESIVWSRQNGGTYIVTPLMYRGRLYMCKQNGILSVYDPASGERKYQQRLKTGPITASPVAADGKVFFVGEDGRVVVIVAGDKFEQVSMSQLGESSLATPAISNGTIVFRTVKKLVAISHDR